MSNRVMLIFSLGPVQSFLAEARRTGDLTAGSKLLSEAARAALQACLEYNGEPIYPASPDRRDQDEANFPNKFVCWVSASQWQEAVNAAQEAARTYLKEKAAKARRELEKAAQRFDNLQEDPRWNDLWKQQLERHFEFFWAVVEEQEGEDGYARTYRLASQAFEAAKRSRLFESDTEEGPKDSLSGTRSALHTSQRDPKTFWNDLFRSGHLNPASLKRGERLDALGATKRFGVDEKAPSVSTIAAVPFIERAMKADLLKPYRDLVEKIDRFYKVRKDPNWPYDGDLLYLETLEEGRLEASYGFDGESLRENAEILRKMREELQRIYDVIGTPSPYFALLVMDGDSMGELVASCRNEETHRRLSEALESFAHEAKEIICHYRGHPVYTGGDDVLAFLPLHQALDATEALSKKYEEIVCPVLGRGTVSAGLAVVHHLYPLGLALNAAREAERMAKNVPGKASLCVRFLKRSGESREARTRWENLHVLSEFSQLFEAGLLSNRFIYEADRTLEVFEDDSSLDWEMIEALLRRLLTRHEATPTSGLGQKQRRSFEPGKWAKTLTEWAQSLPGGVKDLRSWIVLTRWFGQHQEEA